MENLFHNRILAGGINPVVDLIMNFHHPGQPRIRAFHISRIQVPEEVDVDPSNACPRGKPLERRAHFERLANGHQADIGHVKSQARYRGDKPVMGQKGQRTTRRAPAQTIGVAQLGFGDVLTRQDSASHHLLVEQTIGLLAQVGLIAAQIFHVFLAHQQLQKALDRYRRNRPLPMSFSLILCGTICTEACRISPLF